MYKNKYSRAVEEGIKLIGIGKHGSKHLPAVLVQEILVDLNEGVVGAVQKGVLFGALMTKGVERDEKLLEDFIQEDVFASPEQLWNHLCWDVPLEYKPVGIKLIRGEELSYPESKTLGGFLFSDVTGEVFRGMAASILRIRYETNDEFKGLIEAVKDQYADGFKDTTPPNANIIQLAEPFDGVEHSYMITPILAHYFQNMGYKILSMVSSSPGPKFTLTAKDLFLNLDCRFLKSGMDLDNSSGQFGYVIDQKDLSPSLERWRLRRLEMVKRPFLSTIEKVLNPLKAGILITSVFHITYMEKMIELAKMEGFAGVIVLKRGLEGSLAPYLSRASGILCVVRTKSGDYLTREFNISDAEFSKFKSEADETVMELTLEKNLDLINRYSKEKTSGNDEYDKRIFFATGLYQRGVDWILSQI